MEGVASGQAVAAVYDAEGRMVDSKVVAGGEAMLKASKGACIVVVRKGNERIVNKIFVK